MKITETIDRECCSWPNDLKPVKGMKVPGADKSWFCVHCGRLWHSIRKPGEMDAGLEPIEIASIKD